MHPRRDTEPSQPLRSDPEHRRHIQRMEDQTLTFWRLAKHCRGQFEFEHGYAPSVTAAISQCNTLIKLASSDRIAASAVLLRDAIIKGR